MTPEVSRLRRVLVVVLASAILLASGAGLGVAAYLLWFNLLRGQPEPLRRPLFQGVTYERRVNGSPRPVVLHLVRIRIDAPGVRFLVTPSRPRGGRRLQAQTVSGFLARNRLQLAINGDFFRPFRSDGLWDYYPKVGDPVDVFGLACSGRRCFGRTSAGRPTIYFSCSGGASFRRPEDTCHAISGISLLRDGRVRLGPIPAERHPRTAVALDRRERRLLLLVVDGRQPGYSVGATPRELALLAREAGGHNAINLDGGGSSALVMERDGRPHQLNAPIHTRLVGRERPVANHLGVAARPLR
jgi:hypothetical protein